MPQARAGARRFGAAVRFRSAWDRQIEYNGGNRRRGFDERVMGNVLSVQSMVLIVIVAAVALAGLAGTLWVGFSRENREGDPTYERSLKPNWIRLTLLYIAAVAVSAGTLFWFLH